MKKMKTLFVRKFENHTITEITRQVEQGCEWVIEGKGIATRKWDGTCTKIENGCLYRRWDCKKGKVPPIHFIPCQEPDPITGHWPGWIEVDLNNNIGENKFFMEGIQNTFGNIKNAEDGTYEFCGPKINNNPEQLQKHIFIRHGMDILEVQRDFDSIREFLLTHNIEGIVFYHDNGDMCKIKRVDFGFEWNGRTREERNKS